MALDGKKISKTQRMLFLSLKAAGQEQGLDGLVEQLRCIIPSLEDQYSMFKVEGDYLSLKVRQVHAFQIALIKEVIGEFSAPVVVDIGDSSGSHVRYIQELFSSQRKIRAISVNLDLEAVKRIIDKGGEAICARAEDLAAYEVKADIFLCFEVMEHLMNPARFLYDLSSRTTAKYFIATVPFVRRSRVALRHIRERRQTPVSAENTHIFELAPDDWRLLVQHAGWRVVQERIYCQYPRRGLWRVMQPTWAKLDFEGFYGMVLTRDPQWSSLYKDW